MLRSIQNLYDYTIKATDGEIGRVDQFLFDDRHWTVRYLVIDTGGWLSGRMVLVSPIAVRGVHHNDRTIEVDLTRQQVEQSPGIESNQPVSRQKEMEYIQHYGYPPYWEGGGVWGTGLYPAALHPAVAPVPVIPPERTSPQTTTGTTQTSTETGGDPHLRSTREVIDYAIQASDGDLGHVEDFLIDDETWTLRYMVVDTQNWWPGKKVLIAPPWIGDISWADSQVRVDLPREAIKSAPEFDPSKPFDRDYEARLYEHYQQPAYW